MGVTQINFMRYIRQWFFFFLLVVVLAVFAYFYKGHMKGYLPLITPLVLSGLASVMRGTDEGKLNLSGFIIDLALGVVSFNIWAINSVMTSTTRYAMLTPNRILDTTDAIFCLVLALILVGLCALILNHRERAGKPRFLSWIVLMYAVFCFIFPAIIASDYMPPESSRVPAAQQYQISIPFSDESLVNHVGSAKWGNRMLQQKVTVEAGSIEQAKLKALKVFKNKHAFEPLYGEDRDLIRMDPTGLLAEPQKQDAQ
jgi:hypothetical protein